MNKKLQLGVMVLAVSLISSTMVFAEQDYRERNVFNHITDGMVTMFKSSDLKQRVIDERIELRAERRKTSAHKNDKDDELVKKYNDHMNDVNIKDAKEKYENDRKEAMDAWQVKADQEKKDLNNKRENDKRRIQDEKAEENRSYDKQKSEINAQYADNTDMRNAKLKEAEETHEMKIKDLDNQWKRDPEDFDSKEKELNASLDREKSDLEHKFDLRKQELK